MQGGNGKQGMKETILLGRLDCVGGWEPLWKKHLIMINTGMPEGQGESVVPSVYSCNIIQLLMNGIM